MNKLFKFSSVALAILISFTATAENDDEGIGDMSLDKLLKLEIVTVTAQRKVQNIQQVPVSVSAFSGDLIEKSNIKSGAEYLVLTP